MTGAPETIAAAAILHRGTVWSVPRPGRHHDVIARIRREAAGTLPVRGGEAQGFVTSTGRYVDRREGGRLALAAGQTQTLGWGPRLFSEDLW